VPAPRASDPDQVAEIMRTAALAHREVMSEPPPRVLFKKITDAAIEFDLVCFVDEIDTVARVTSDLYFAIYRRLREVGIVPTAAAPIAVSGLDQVKESLDEIADAIEHGQEPPAEKAPVKPRPESLAPRLGTRNGPRAPKATSS
jgi:potassium-dependent mechanosensitive channel